MSEMDGGSCRSCKFWAEEMDWMGRCRRYPPMILSDRSGVRVEFPKTEAVAWCGEFQKGKPT
jgi:hypothetical protein